MQSGTVMVIIANIFPLYLHYKLPDAWPGSEDGF